MTAKKANGLKHGEGGIRERARDDGTIVYQARWYVADPFKGDRVFAKSFPTQDAAEDHLRKILRQKRDGTYAVPTEITVSKLVADYIDRAASRVADRTVLTYRSRAASMIDPSIGKKKLLTIGPLEVQRWIDSLLKAGFNPSTIHAAVAVLNGALREAALLGIVDRNLAQGVRRPTIRLAPANVWTTEQARLVMDATREDPIYGALYHIALVTGMRPGELRALMWADIQLDAGSIVVRRTVSKGQDGVEFIAERTKSKKSRAIGINADTAERLRWHRDRQAERKAASFDWKETGVVFDRGDGHWLYQSQWLRFHNELCARLGVPRIRHHDLRHSVATMLMERNIHPSVVADILGHSEINMTLDRYTHVSLQHQRLAINTLSDDLMSPDPAAKIASKLEPSGSF